MKHSEIDFWERYSAYDARWNAGGHHLLSGSLDSVPITDMFSRTGVEFPELAGEKPIAFPARTPAGTFEMGIMALRFHGWGHPTLVWCHGFRERPFAFGKSCPNTVCHMFPPECRPDGWNMLILGAPFHNGDDAHLFHSLADLGAYVAMMVAPAVCAGEIVRQNAAAGGRTVLAGISMGGAVMNLHRACANTADAYVPLLAGAASDEVLLSPLYRDLVSGHALVHPEPVHRAINFENAYMAVADDNVFPLLARYDRYVEFERQKQCYGNRNIRVLERGHITAAFAPTELRGHVMSVLKLFAPLHR